MVGESNTKIEPAEENPIGKCGHEILPGQMFFKGKYLERLITKRNLQTFKEMPTRAFYL